MPESTPKDIGAVSGTARTTSAVPTGTPPKRHGAAAAGATGAVGTVWNNNQLVNALWSINEDRNSWVGIQGVGWVKLSTSSDSGVITLTVLAAHAKQLQSVVNYRVEDDGMIHEIYAW